MKYFSLLGKNMKDRDIVDVDFSGADLTGADFSGSNIIADFTGADLTGAKFMCGKMSRKTFDSMSIKPKCKHKLEISMQIVEDENLLREDIQRGPEEPPLIPPVLVRTDMVILK